MRGLYLRHYQECFDTWFFPIQRLSFKVFRRFSRDSAHVRHLLRCMLYSRNDYLGAGDAAFGSAQVKILLCRLVIIVAYASLFFALSSILQKTGGAIALCIVLPMALTVVLNLADTALAEREIVLSRYWLSKLINSVGSITVEKDALKDALLYSAIYIPVSLAAGWLATMKREY